MTELEYANKKREIVKKIDETQTEYRNVIHHIKECELALSVVTNKLLKYWVDYESLIQKL